MRPLIRQLWELQVHIDYRPGGVSMTNYNFAKLELDRRMNAERALFLLSKISPVELARLGIPPDDGHPNALHRQVSALDEKINELHAAHDRLTQHYKGPPIDACTENASERQYIRAMREGGASPRFVNDGFSDYVRRVRK